MNSFRRFFGRDDGEGGQAVVLFAIFCTFNCLCIASWERELDNAQGKTAFLTWWPAFAR